MATLASTYNTRRFPARELTWDAPAKVHEPEAPQRATAQQKPAAAPTARLRLPSISISPILYGPLDTLHRALQWSLLASVGLCLALFGLQFPHSPEWDRTWLIVQLHQLADPILAGIAVWTRSQWPDPGSISYLPLGLALAIWLTRRAARAAFLPVLNVLRPPEPAEGKVRRSGVFVEDEAGGFAVSSEQSRESLLRRYRAIDGALKATKRTRCAFLSIDIAGSTAMKESEQELPVTITFQAYVNMLEEIFLQHNAWKQAWTPDGVMVCFQDLDTAAAAAQTVLRRLRVFNRTENLLKTRISVRCGLNEGRIAIFEDSKLEKIAHQVIDVAGHMQKHANPDTLCLGAEVYGRLGDKSRFRPTTKEVDGYQVYEWSPSLALPELPSLPLNPRQKPGNSDPTWF